MVSSALASERVLRARTPRDLAAWASAVDGAMTRFEIAPPSPSRFDGRLRTMSVGSTSMTTIDSAGHILRHPPSAPDEDTVALITLVNGGTADVIQSGHRSLLRRGDLALYFSANACEVVCDDDYRCFSIGVPARALALGRHWWEDPERMVIRRESPVAASLAHAMTGLQASAGVVARTTRRDVVDGTVHLVGALLRGDPSREPTVEAPERRDLLDTIDEYIWNNLADPSLDVHAISIANHVSVRRVYQLFEKIGQTPAAVIRRRRLERVRRELADPSMARRTVSECAARWGFTNPSHFGALFRTTYGLGPRDYVEAAAHLPGTSGERADPMSRIRGADGDAIEPR